MLALRNRYASADRQRHRRVPAGCGRDGLVGLATGCSEIPVYQRGLHVLAHGKRVAAENDPAMTERILVGQLIDPPSVLLRPSWMRRVGLRAVNGFRTSLPS
jgi:hypothetical protein